MLKLAFDQEPVTCFFFGEGGGAQHLPSLKTYPLKIGPTPKRKGYKPSIQLPGHGSKIGSTGCASVSNRQKGSCRKESFHMRSMLVAKCLAFCRSLMCYQKTCRYQDTFSEGIRILYIQYVYIYIYCELKSQATQVLAATHEVHCQSQTHVQPFCWLRT